MTSIPGTTGRPISSEGPSEAPLTLAVVIPTLNEESQVPALLASLNAQTRPAERILVVDGGSSDATLSAAQRFGIATISVDQRGRGGQIAAGVAQITEDIVLVAHADMIVPPGALAEIRRVMAAQPACPGGCLGHHFDSPTMPLKLIEWCDRRRASRGQSYGDQAQFFRRRLLQEHGGFPDQPLMEDVELSRRLCLGGAPVYLNVPVTVSARRFQRLPWWKVVWTNWRLRRAYRRHGLASCASLYERYYSGNG